MVDVRPLLTAQSTEPPVGQRPPLIVDLDGTLARTDTLYETFAAAFFPRPLATLIAIMGALFAGRARLKRSLATIAALDLSVLPLHGPLVDFLEVEKRSGRELHMATAADAIIALGVAERTGLFTRVWASDGTTNLKGRTKGEALAGAFPAGFSYAGDASADLEVWKFAASAVVVAPRWLAQRAAAVTEVERHFAEAPPGPRAWLRAARPHQWTKNLLLLVPCALGWSQLTPMGLAHAVEAMVLMCLLSSLTYIVNDVADVGSDRHHERKRWRPFACGALPLRDGLLAAAFGLPAILASAWWLTGPTTALALLTYAGLTLAYSMGLKRVPLVDCVTIGALFTLRLVAGVTAAGLFWSPWLLTFSLTFFFSLAMAKRLTELVAGVSSAAGIHGRGFRHEDRPLVLALGVAASTLSILIVVLYLMEEVFPLGAYRHPVALWAAPPLIFLWTGRIWLLANRGQMHHDPVVFALRDRVSYGLGAMVGAALLTAVL